MTAAEIDAALAADPDFAAVCDARRDGWIAAHELAERVVQCTHCGRWVPWYAVDTDGRCDRCPAARRAA